MTSNQYFTFHRCSTARRRDSSFKNSLFYERFSELKRFKNCSMFSSLMEANNKGCFTKFPRLQFNVFTLRQNLHYNDISSISKVLCLRLWDGDFSFLLCPSLINMNTIKMLRGGRKTTVQQRDKYLSRKFEIGGKTDIKLSTI